MVGNPSSEAQVFGELNQKKKKRSNASLNEKPNSVKHGSSGEKIVKVAVNYQSVPQNPTLKPGKPEPSSLNPLSKGMKDEATFTEAFESPSKRHSSPPNPPLLSAGDSDHIRVDLRDICPPSRSSSVNHSVGKGGRQERNRDFDDEDDMSVDSNDDPKYIFEDDFEDASFRAVDTKDERAESIREIGHEKDTENRDYHTGLRVDMDNLRLKFDYDDQTPLVEDEGEPHARPGEAGPGVERIRALGGCIGPGEKIKKNLTTDKNIPKDEEVGDEIPRESPPSSMHS